MLYDGKTLREMTMAELGRALVDCDETRDDAIDIMQQIAEVLDVEDLDDDEAGVICRGLFWFATEGGKYQRAAALWAMKALHDDLSQRHDAMINHWIQYGKVKPRPRPVTDKERAAVAEAMHDVQALPGEGK